MRTALTVARQEVQLLFGTLLVPMILYLVMPLAILAFVEGGFSLFLNQTDPGMGFSGADLAAPGQATMFGFMCLGVLGFLFLGEFSWGTWNRIRALGVTTWHIMAGKLAVSYVYQWVLFCFVMGAGYVLFDLTVRGSLVALLAVEAVMALVIVAYGLIACALSTNQAQFNAFAYLGALVMAGLGGALTPFETLPGWAQAVAPAVPTYWAVRAFEEIILQGGGLADVRLEMAVLALVALCFFIIGALVLNPDRQRTTWA